MFLDEVRHALDRGDADLALDLGDVDPLVHFAGRGQRQGFSGLGVVAELALLPASWLALLLSAGDGIGTNAGASVHATLFCGPATSPTASDEAGVPLDAAGNFQINDVLTPVPESPCESPVLLIRSGAAPGQGVWFAAGIPVSNPAHAVN